MRSWVLAAIVLVLAAAVGAECLQEPAANSTQSVLHALTGDLRFTYHECVPLGWQPVPVHGTYYPGYTASAQNYAEWLDALWRGYIPRRDLRQAQARAVYATLNHLASSGLLVRETDASGYRYFLTPRALGYYYGSSSFKDNRDSLPYLCYSNIVPQRIDWIAKISAPNGTPVRDDAQWYRLQFSWKPGSPASWADSFIRAHSVVLAPLTSPTTARVLLRDGQWYLENVYDRGWMLPALSAARTHQRRIPAAPRPKLLRRPESHCGEAAHCRRPLRPRPR